MFDMKKFNDFFSLFYISCIYFNFCILVYTIFISNLSTDYTKSKIHEIIRENIIDHEAQQSLKYKKRFVYCDHFKVLPERLLNAANWGSH